MHRGQDTPPAGTHNPPRESTNPCSRVQRRPRRKRRLRRVRRSVETFDPLSQHHSDGLRRRCHDPARTPPNRAGAPRQRHRRHCRRQATAPHAPITSTCGPATPRFTRTRAYQAIRCAAGHGGARSYPATRIVLDRAFDPVCDQDQCRDAELAAGRHCHAPRQVRQTRVPRAARSERRRGQQRLIAAPAAPLSVARSRHGHHGRLIIEQAEGVAGPNGELEMAAAR